MRLELPLELSLQSNQLSNQQTSDQLAETHWNQAGWNQEVRIFASTFLTIFLAELGDKTQVTTLLMTAESHSPWVVFAGAGSALVLTSLLGVSLGNWLAKRVPPRTLEISAGILLAFISVLLFWDVMNG